jgi:hypothetical protein
MIRYRCKCGESTALGTMDPPACEGCEKCHTRLVPAQLFNDADEEFLKPLPHEWSTQMVETDEGMKPLTRCIMCHRSRKELEGE